MDNLSVHQTNLDATWAARIKFSGDTYICIHNKLEKGFQKVLVILLNKFYNLYVYSNF